MRAASFDFGGERYVVTGASSGMGREIALSLARSGAKVLALARREEKLAELAARMPGRIIPAAVDVCDTAALEEALRRFVEAHGSLSGTVHAAGTAVFTPLAAYNIRKAQKMMETTFWAGMALLQMATRPPYAGERTSHVLFSSADAVCCEMGKFAYAAAKAAVNAGVRSAAKELARKGHRVNAVMPGWVATEMTQGPLARAYADEETISARELLGMGEPSDVAEFVLFLLSDSARWMTGACLAVDGGYSA